MTQLLRSSSHLNCGTPFMTNKRNPQRSKVSSAKSAKPHSVARSAVAKKSDRSKVVSKAGSKPVAKAASKPGNNRVAKFLKSSPKPVVRQKAARRDTTLEDIAVGNVGSSKFMVDGPKQAAPKMPDLPRAYGRDRIVVMVRDPFWLHVYWEITEHSIRRAETSLEQEWHGAKAILRVMDITSEESTNYTEKLVKDIDIYPGCNNWYIDVQKPNRTYRVDIGYITKSGRFYVMCRSNSIITPRPNSSDQIDENWADVQQKLDKIYALSGGYDKNTSSFELRKLFEERLRRPMSSQVVTSLGSGAFGSKSRKFFFNIDAELIVYGATEPSAKVMIQGEPVQLRPDGTFTMRYSLPDGRQILPAVAYSGDGVEERTIVLAVERNTKALEPLIHEASE
jgi:hypothetical protein